MSRNNSDLVDLSINTEDLEAIISRGDGKTLVEKAENAGGLLQRNGLTTNQIRAIFGTVRQLEMNWGGDSAYKLQLLKPKMFYRASREGTKGRGLQALAEILSEAIDLVLAENQTDPDHRQRFNRFVDFFEAILAYHKVAGGS